VHNDFVLSRLLGDVAGKRILELGCGDGSRAVALSRAGGHVIALDPDAAAVRAARARAEQAEVRVETHTMDLADLAFLRGDSVDVAFAEGSLVSVADLGRVLRQVQRVLRAGARFAFTLPHPFATCAPTEPTAPGALPLGAPTVTRSYFDDGGPNDPPIHRIGDVFAALGRAGFQIDTLLEPEPAPGAARRALLPDTIIWRARKIGS
jgi:SAM-dependent methyltransferase